MFIKTENRRILLLPKNMAPIVFPGSLDTIGDRIRAVRTFCDPSRTSFCKKHNLSSMKLTTWELGQNRPRQDALLSLLEVFRNNGVFCSTKWILEKLPPSPVVFSTKPHAKTCSGYSTTQTLSQEIIFFESLSPSHVVTQVEDDVNAPYINRGDMVGGFKITSQNAKLYYGRLCIFDHPDREGYTVVRILSPGTKGRYTLTATNLKDCATEQPIFYDFSLKFCAPIIWHRAVF